MIFISYAKRLEFDERINTAEIKSFRIARYFLEHPDKRSERIAEIEKLERDIIFSGMEQQYIDDGLNKIDLTLHILRQQYNPFLIFGLGIIAGAGIKSAIDYVADWLIREGSAYSSESQRRPRNQL